MKSPNRTTSSERETVRVQTWTQYHTSNDKTDKLYISQTIPRTVYFDISKDFEKVWQNGLICKMAKKDTPSHLVKTIHNFITNRTLEIKLYNQKFRTVRMAAGALQGFPLSPTHLHNRHPKPSRILPPSHVDRQHYHTNHQQTPREHYGQTP